MGQCGEKIHKPLKYQCLGKLAMSCLLFFEKKLNIQHTTFFLVYVCLEALICAVHCRRPSDYCSFLPTEFVPSSTSWGSSPKPQKPTLCIRELLDSFILSSIITSVSLLQPWQQHGWSTVFTCSTYNKYPVVVCFIITSFLFWTHNFFNFENWSSTHHEMLEIGVADDKEQAIIAKKLQTTNCRCW